MWVAVAIIILLIYYFGMQADKGLDIRHTKNMYNHAIKTKGLTYYDSRSKCTRCVKTNLPVSEFTSYDENHNEFRYTVFTAPSLNGNAQKLLVAAEYYWGDARGKAVNVSEEWLQKNHLVRIQDYKAKYNPWWLRTVNI